MAARLKSMVLRTHALSHALQWTPGNHLNEFFSYFITDYAAKTMDITYPLHVPIAFQPMVKTFQGSSFTVPMAYEWTSTVIILDSAKPNNKKDTRSIWKAISSKCTNTFFFFSSPNYAEIHQFSAKQHGVPSPPQPGVKWQPGAFERPFRSHLPPSTQVYLQQVTRSVSKNK